MKLKFALLVFIFSPTVGLIHSQTPTDVATFRVAENGDLKAVVRLTKVSSFTDTNWLQLEITNGGPAAMIKSAALSATVDEDLHGRSTTHEQVPLGIPAEGLPSKNSVDYELPAGTYNTGQLSELLSNVLRIPSTSEAVLMHLVLKIALEDGRSVATDPAGVVIPFTWAPPGHVQMKALQDEAVTLLLRSTAGTPPLSNAEVARMRLLLTTPSTSEEITLDQALAAIKQGQRNGKFQSGEVLGLVQRRWPDDPAVISFYSEALKNRGREALRDLAGQVGSPWDDSFVQPIVRLIEKAAAEVPTSVTSRHDTSQVIDDGLSLLDRHYASWHGDPWIPGRLSRAVLQARTLDSGHFYSTVAELEQTHDRQMILVLRPFLIDKTTESGLDHIEVDGRGGDLDSFTSLSSNMPYGVTPMRLCDIAANGISRLMGQPDIISTWNRASAPDGGPYPEWDDWDKKIAALQRRLSAGIGEPWPNIMDTVKNLPAQVAELPGAQVRVYGDTVEAIYNIPADPKDVPIRRPVVIQISSYSSIEEAERGVQMSLHITSIAPTSKRTTGGVAIYKWDTQAVNLQFKGSGSHRITSRIGLYVVTVEGTSQATVDKAYGTVVQELGTH